MKDTLSALIVDDSETDAKLIAKELRRTGHVVAFERVEDAESMQAALTRSTWSVVISDWTMPRFNAMAALGVLKKTGHDIPFIIVSGTIGEDVAAEALHAGAQDFVLKDRLARLAPAVEREIRECRTRESQRRAENALRASEARYRRIIETTSVGVWMLDADARTSFMSARMARMLGYDVGEAIGIPVYDFITGDEDRARTRERLETRGRAISGQTELELRRKDGSAVWTLIDSSAVFDESGRFEGTLGMVTDISERKSAEAALRRSEARFARLSESGIVGIALTDVHGTIHDANATYLALLGYTRADLAAGLLWSTTTPEEYREADSIALSNLEKTGVAPPWEKELVRKDGTRVSVLVGVAMLDPPNCISFVADLTERKRVEGALRTSEDKLRQSQKLEAIGGLAAGVAHDFNNLLSVILSYTELCIDALPPESPLHNDLHEVQTAGEHAAALTRQLLAFSRQQVLQPRVIDVAEVLARLEKILRRLIGEDVDLVLIAPPGLQTIMADPSQIEQILLNLAINARDAMPRGGKLSIVASDVTESDLLDGASPSSHHEPHVVIRVSDTGCGMEAAVRARIFEPFFTTKGPGKGTGLGLATVLGIVQQSGGTVDVESEPGAGTTFTMRFPATAASRRAASDRPPADPRLRGGAETILLVEDDDALRVLAQTILRRHGYTVLDARSGGDALLLFEQHGPAIDLLLTDVVMPRMNGRQLTARLQQARPDIRVLYISGYTDDATVHHGVLHSEVAFLQKPITPEALVRKVREVLDDRRRR